MLYISFCFNLWPFFPYYKKFITTGSKPFSPPFSASAVIKNFITAGENDDHHWLLVEPMVEIRKKKKLLALRLSRLATAAM